MHRFPVHAGPLALLAALTIAWTWPLAPHLGDAIAGLPGDNYSFLWASVVGAHGARDARRSLLSHQLPALSLRR